MSDEVTRQAAEASADRNVDRESYDWMVRDRDNWQQRAETAERERTESRAEALQLRREYQAERAEVEATREERDAARADLAKERDAAESEIAALRHQRDAALAEAEGLRADLLAHPPEVHAELAAERQRHVELMEDFDRQAVTITMLQEALRRTENALKTAQAKHIDPRLKGLLWGLSRTASEAEKMLP